MKVRCVRENAFGLDIGQTAIDLFDHLYDRKSPPEAKDYRPGLIGYESFVYALMIKGGHIFFYIRDPVFGDISHAPSVCFDLIDNRASKYWHMKHNYVHQEFEHPMGNCFTSTLFAIKEWIEEPTFLNNYVEGRKREVEILEVAAKQIEEEYE